MVAYMKNIADKTILITGGTGSWGHELVTQLLAMKSGPKEIRIYSRNEHKQVEMRSRFTDPRIRFIIGDVRDKNILNFAMNKVNTVFHLAALKHVPVCEDNSWEAVLTNIVGTQNVIETAISNNVAVVVDVSTDKAVDPYNHYGVTKACGEKLIINANKLPARTKFICVRGGNVIGTNGSVIPLFKRQLLENNQVTITDPLMTRYLMSTNQAISLLFEAIENHTGGEIFVLNMPATTVDIIADTMISLFGNKTSKKTIIGTRPGEKRHEVLISKNEIAFTETTNSHFYTIFPAFKSVTIMKKLDLPEFSSQNTKQLSSQELSAILQKERWLFS